MYNFNSRDKRYAGSYSTSGGATGSYTISSTNDPRKASDDVVYVNIDVYNSNPTTAIPMELTPITRTQPLVNRASDYYCSVVRFEIPKVNIPYFEFPTSAPFFADKQFYITFSDGTTDTTQQLAYVVSGIASPSGSQPIFFVNQFLKSVNDAFIAVNAQAIIDGVAGVTANPPFIRQLANGKFEILVDQAATFQLWFNWNLYRFFNGIFGFYAGYNNPNLKDEMIYYLPADTGLIGNTVTIGGVTYLQATQEYPGFFLWESVAGIILATSTIPILSEFTQGNDTSGNNVTLKSLTDFIPSKDEGIPNVTPYQFYSNQPRLIDMKGSDPITKFDLKLFYRDTYNLIIPMTLAPFSSFSVKLMFVKKSLYDNEYGGNYPALPLLGQ